MSKSEAIRKLYATCKDINFDETYNLISEAKSDEEKDFIRIVTDFILQQKQKKVIMEKRF